MGHRLLRINERIKEIVSAAIAGEVKDPRVGFVTVTGVETSSDLRHAKVFVSVLGSQAQREETLEALRQSRGLLQSSINAGLRMKRTPQITFIYDATTDQAQHIERLIRREEAELAALRPPGSETEEPAADESETATPDESETAAPDESATAAPDESAPVEDETDEKAGA